jgi:hypothetical protein
MSTAGSVRGCTSLSGEDPGDYERHLLHSAQRTYAETNCYVDVLVELLHACDYEPLAMLAHIVRMDFEGDQWTFFKPPPEDLEALYGIDIHEMQPYREIPTQIEEQLELGRAMIVELDSWYLPDTATTSYRSNHVKTSCSFDAIDRERGTLRYFHGPGLFELSGEDYNGVFRIGEFSDDVLPPYTEIVRFDAGERLEGEELHLASIQTLRHHMSKLPGSNPVSRFGRALVERLPSLRDESLEAYHAYAFATVRLAGSGFEALGSYLEWLFGPDAAPLADPINGIVDASKALSFRLARRREFDADELLGAMARSWEQTMMLLAGMVA